MKIKLDQHVSADLSDPRHDHCLLYPGQQTTQDGREEWAEI